MKKTLLFCVGVVMLSALGCAHTTRSGRGVVEMKVTDQEGHVSLGQGDVRVGTPVAFFREVCEERRTREPLLQSCETVKVGEGEVTGVLNDNYSVVRADPGVMIEENMVVETIEQKSVIAE